MYVSEVYIFRNNVWNNFFSFIDSKPTITYIMILVYWINTNNSNNTTNSVCNYLTNSPIVSYKYCKILSDGLQIVIIKYCVVNS